MSAAQHEREGTEHTTTAESHAARFDPSAAAIRERCSSRLAVIARKDVGELCWTSVTNPTAAHERDAALHRRHAADHRAASAALRDAEARACTGVTNDDRDISPFERVEDILGVEPFVDVAHTDRSSPPPSGAVVTFHAVPGMTVENLQRIVDCHLARNASVGHVAPEAPDCPLVPKGAEARVAAASDGFAVTISSDDPQQAAEILARARRLRPVGAH